MRIEIYGEIVKEIVRLLTAYGRDLEGNDTKGMTGEEIVLRCRQIGDVAGMAAWLERELKKQNEPTEVDPITD